VTGLWLVVVALVLGIVLGTGDFFGKHAAHQTPVARYITSVDDLQQQMRVPLGQLRTAYETFSTTKSDPQEQATLAASARTLHTFGRRLVALPAPPAAATLRRLMGQFVAAEEGLATELVELAGFMPRFQGLVGVTTAARSQLGRALAAAVPPNAHAVRGTPKQIAAAKAAYAAASERAELAQADAVGAYDRALALALGQLRTLRPPALMAPAYRTQVQELAATQRAGDALAAVLRTKDLSQVPALSRRFTEASRLTGSLAAQRAEVAAVKAYDARVRAVSTVEVRAQREVARLQRLAK
jgi:hypothetical protein